MEGYLVKQQLIRSQRRYFRLEGTTLSYSDDPASARKGEIMLRQADQVLFDDKALRITIRGKELHNVKKGKEKYVLVAPTPSDYFRWRGTIRRVRALSAASLISSSTSFTSLIDGFRRCVNEAVEASILDLSEYSADDFSSLQQRHEEHARRVRQLNAVRRRRSNSAADVSLDDDADLFELQPVDDAAPAVGGRSWQTDSGASSTTRPPHLLLTSAAPPRPGAAPARPLSIPAPRTRNPLPGGGAAAVDRLLGPGPRGAEHDGGRGLLHLPTMTMTGGVDSSPGGNSGPPMPGSTNASFDSRMLASERFSGPAWHYLDVLNHAGGLMSSVQYIATDEELAEHWNMFATSEAGCITEGEHRAMLAHLVGEVKGTLPVMLADIVTIVLRAYGIEESDDRPATGIVAACGPTLRAIADAFHASLLAELDSLAAEMWAGLDEERRGRVGRDRFMAVYRCRPIVPSSSLIDVTLDEVGSLIQRKLLRRTSKILSERQAGPPPAVIPSSSGGYNATAGRRGGGGSSTPPHTDFFHAPPAPRLGDCGLANLGNTCYMNAALQCLAHAPLLRQHLLLGKHHAANRSTMPLSDSLAELFRVMFDGTTNTTSPQAVREAINARTGDFFAGITQHDAQELLMAVLDGLHEEMNTGRRGQYVELPDKPTRPDAELAEEWWGAHTRANQSPIVDWFHGQCRTSTTCNVCGNVSLCFDPFSVLTAPIAAPVAAAAEQQGQQQRPAAANKAAQRPPSRSASSGSSSDDDAASFSDSFNDSPSDAFSANWLTVPCEDSPPRTMRRARRERQRKIKTTGAAAEQPVVMMRASDSTAAVPFDPFDLETPAYAPTPPRHTDNATASGTGAGGEPKAAVVTLESCLDALFRAEVLDGDDAIHCSHCKQQQPSTRRVTLWRVPYYLTVGLTRFRHDRTGQVLSKNTAKVRVPERLDPARWLDRASNGGSYLSGVVAPSHSSAAAASPLYSGVEHAGMASSAASGPSSPRTAAIAGPAPFDSSTGHSQGSQLFGTSFPPSASAAALGVGGGNGEYELIAVIRHSGWISGGHYTASCLSDGRWMLYNDGMVERDLRGPPRDPDDGVYVALYRLRRPQHQPPAR